MILRQSWLLLWVAIVAFAVPAWAQSAASSPDGLWRTVDARTGRDRGLIRIFERQGALYGRIEQAFDSPVATCENCRDDRRGQPVVGLEIMRGLRSDGAGRWSGGEILDPESGDTYRASVQLTDLGRKLIVRGSILGGLIGGSQTWLRAEPK